MDIVVVGSINADIWVRVHKHPEIGETVSGLEQHVLSGGKGANQAVAAACCGANVKMVGAVGKDAFSEGALAGLRAAEVDLDAVAEIPTSTGLALVTVNDKADNSIVVISGANSHVDGHYVKSVIKDLAAPELIICQGETPISGVEEALNLALANNARFVFNAAPVGQISQNILKHCDPLIVNEIEAVELCAQFVEQKQEINKKNIAPEETVAIQLLELGAKSVIITLGAQGALVAYRQNEKLILRAVSSPMVEAVDTTGAGDGFVGALCAKLAQRKPLLTATEEACEFAAESCLYKGAQAAYLKIKNRQTK